MIPVLIKDNTYVRKSFNYIIKRFDNYHVKFEMKYFAFTSLNETHESKSSIYLKVPEKIIFPMGISFIKTMKRVILS